MVATKLAKMPLGANQHTAGSENLPPKVMQPGLVNAPSCIFALS